MKAQARKIARENSPNYTPPVKRSCESCIHFVRDKEKKRKVVGKDIFDKRKIEEVEVVVYKCRKYDEYINKLDRATLCPAYQNKREQLSLDATVSGFEGDIREWQPL